MSYFIDHANPKTTARHIFEPCQNRPCWRFEQMGSCDNLASQIKTNDVVEYSTSCWVCSFGKASGSLSHSGIGNSVHSFAQGNMAAIKPADKWRYARNTLKVYQMFSDMKAGKPPFRTSKILACRNIKRRTEYLIIRPHLHRCLFQAHRARHNNS